MKDFSTRVKPPCISYPFPSPMDNVSDNRIVRFYPHLGLSRRPAPSQPPPPPN